MSLVQKMIDREDFTEIEVSIAEYILAYPEVVLTSTTRDLAKSTYTSPTTIVRFCQKLGLTGFPQFKIRLSAEMNAKKSGIDHLDITPITGSDSVYQILQKVRELEESAIVETQAALDYKMVTKVVDLLDKAEQIDFYGSGVNLHLAHEASYLFMRLGKKVSVSESSSIHMAQTYFSNEKHVAIILSHSGETAKHIEAVKILQKRRTKTVCLCGYMNSKLAKLCDICIYIKPGKRFIDMGPLIFSTSTRYVLHTFFAVLFSWKYEKHMTDFEDYIKWTATLEY